MTSFVLFLGCATAPRLGMLPCPPTPNCVSSLAPVDDPEHHVGPLRASDWDRLDEVIRAMPRVEAHASRDDYRHYTFKTALMRFTDDVELQRTDDLVHIRSASRVGHSDLGVNRRRVEAIRARMADD